MVILLPRTGKQYPHYPESSTEPSREGIAPLSEPHRRMLVEESGINADIIAERSYYTARATSEIPEAFSRGQRRLGLVIPMFSPDDITRSSQLRPYKPLKDKKGKPKKYMTPTGVGNIIDVHPRNKEAVTDSSVDLWITEGVKKGDAMTTHGLCAISLAGVWCWCVKNTKGKELLPDWDHVALHGRNVFVVYDSDVMVQPKVEQALERLVTVLEGRGASVQVVYLPDAPDGSKNGVDDYLVGGGMVDEMYRMARPFDRGDYAETRLSRDEKLRAAVAGLWAKWKNHEWKAKGKPRSSRRKVWRAFVEEAERSGELVDGVMDVELSERQIVERTGLSRVTVHKAIDGLVDEEGVLQRNTRKGKAIDEASTYTLLVPSNSYCVTQLDHHGNDSPSVDASPASRSAVSPSPPDHAASLHSGLAVSRNDGYEATQAAALEELKRLRWSYTMRVQTDEGYDYEYVERIDPIPGEAFETLLLELRGDAHVTEVIKAMGRTDRPSRFIKRIASKLEVRGMIRITEGQRLIVLPEWVANLGLAREMGGEYVAERLTKERHEREREGFQLALRRGKPQPQPEAPPERADGYIEDLERVEEVPVEEEHEHDLGCDCIDCSIPAPRYAVPYGMRAA